MEGSFSTNVKLSGVGKWQGGVSGDLYINRSDDYHFQG